jgi:hypothetical protein
MPDHPAIEALKATAPHRFSPMPWKPDTAPGDDEPMIRDANGDDVGRFAVAEDRNHALSATLAAPHLLARVAELEGALETARVAAQSLPVYRTDDARIRLDLDDVLEINAAARNVCLALGLEVK